MTRDECIEIVQANLRFDDTPRGRRLRMAWDWIVLALVEEGDIPPAPECDNLPSRPLK